VLTEVLVYGFPMGGDTLSITRGVVSRLEHIEYVHSLRKLLGAQVDAAINPGNSGGPALVADRVVGLAMQGIPRAQNLGYLVPVTVIEHFLADADDGNVDGVPALGVETQDLENPDLRRKYAVPADRTGVLVTATLPGSPTSGSLQRGDVLLSIEGHAIANNGTVEFRPSERTSFRYFADIRQVGEAVDLEVLRDSRVQPVHIQLTPWGKRLNLLGSWLYEVPPRYLVFGGLVFAPASRNLANAIDYSEPLWTLDKKRPGAATEEAVVLVKVLAGVVNEGYHRLAGEVITQVNGAKPKDFADFVRLLEGADGTFLTLAYEGGDKEIVLDRERARAESGRILARYGVRADRSADLAAAPTATGAVAGEAAAASGPVALAQKAER
jgi:S1-C subfamily serine protease